MSDEHRHILELAADLLASGYEEVGSVFTEACDRLGVDGYERSEFFRRLPRDIVWSREQDRDEKLAYCLRRLGR